MQGSVSTSCQNSPLTRFQVFERVFPDWEDRFGVYDRDQDERYKRIDCVWQDNEITHHYHATINVQTGDIYLDCRRRKIFAKILLSIFIRPAHIVVKTLWHASIIGPTITELIKTAKKQQSLGDGVRHCGLSIADIAITPLLGTAMLIMSIATLLIAPFSQNFLYKGRAIIGTLERKMHHDNDPSYDSFPMLTPCFSPVRNIATIYSRKNASSMCTEESTREGLSTLARNFVEVRQTYRVLFNDCFQVYPKDQPYISAAAK